MILNGIHINDINISNTYDNVVHLNVDVSTLYPVSNSVYKLYDGNGYEVPFKFKFNTPVVLSTDFKIDTTKTVFGFTNCNYNKINVDVSDATITNILTANQINKISDNKFTIHNTGIVNHTLDTAISAEHSRANEQILAAVDDKVANYEYFKAKSAQLKDECLNYASSFNNPKDALVIAYNNYGETLSFKVSSSQFPPSGKLTAIIIGTFVTYVGENQGGYYGRLYVNGSKVQNMRVSAYASTGKGGKSECHANISFLYTMNVDANTLYNIKMVCDGSLDSPSIVVLCGEVIS